MAALPALLHDPVSGTSRQVEVEWEPERGGSLRVSGQGRTWSVPAEALSVAGAGWNGEGLTLAWDEDGRSYAVSVGERAAAVALRSALANPRGAPAAPVAAQAVELERREGVRRRRGRILAAAFAAVLLAMLLGLVSLYLLRDRILDAVVRRLPVTVDERLGRLVQEQVAASGGLATEGPALQAVRAAGGRLAGGAGYRFDLLRDGAVNAFAAPGGYIVVHSGLVAQAESIDELYGVLAHEITHVRERHSLRQMVFRLGTAGLVRLLIGGGEGAAERIAAAAVDLGALRFSREQESAADRGAVDLLKQAGLPASGLPRFFARLAAEGGTPPALLASHPAPAARLEAIEREIAARAPWPAAAPEVDWKEAQRDARKHDGGAGSAGAGAAEAEP